MQKRSLAPKTRLVVSLRFPPTFSAVFAGLLDAALPAAALAGIGLVAKNKHAI